MSKQCPNCGSYNTEHRVTGIVGYSAVQGARFVTAGVAAIAMGLFNRSTGPAAGTMVMRNTKDWGETIHRHYCCNCNKSFK